MHNDEGIKFFRGFLIGMIIVLPFWLGVICLWVSLSAK